MGPLLNTGLQPEHLEKGEDGAEMSRRECLSWISRAATLALASGAIRCVHAGGEGVVKIADLIRIPNESARLIESPNVILSRTGKGIACMSTMCTHRRNKLEVDSDGNIFCPVHDSRFDLDGNPSGGPATRPLTWYRTAVEADGAISVDPSKTVKQGAWAELPGWAKPKTKS